MSVSQHDVIVVGGGVIGLTTALALAKLSSLNILVLESRPEASNWQSAKSEDRVSAISLASQRIFANLGIWEWIAAREISPFQGMHVWSAMGSGVTDFSAAESSVPALGYIIANRLLEAALSEALRQCPQVSMQYSVKPANIIFCPDHVEIQDESGMHHCAKLVIGADGAHSRMRELAGISQKIRAYDQTALVATVQTEFPHEAIARQCFLPAGPLAFLPLLDSHTCSIVWSTTQEEAVRLQALSDKDFCASLSLAFQHHLGTIQQVSGRGAFLLIMRHAEKYVRERFALVGDAAHTIHPLAGQGMNLGLLDAATLAETVAEAANNKRQFAGFHTLRRYERARKADNLAMIHAMDFFHRVASHPGRIVQGVWQAGMHGVNQMPFIKKWLVGYAFGEGRELPVLATSV